MGRMIDPRARWFDWLLVAAWMGLIFGLSATPNLRSGLDTGWDLLVRKIAHAGEYAMLGWLVSRALRRSGVGRRRALVAALITCLVYALSDEWHQSFIAGRSGSPIDVVVDGFGVLLGIGLYFRRR